MGESVNIVLVPCPCPCPSLPASCLTALRSVDWLLGGNRLLVSPLPIAAIPPPLASFAPLLVPSRPRPRPALLPLDLRDMGDPDAGEGADRGLWGDPLMCGAGGLALAVSCSALVILSNTRLSKLFLNCSSYREEGKGIVDVSVWARGVCVM